MVVSTPLAPLIDRLMAELGLSRAEFATALDASERSVARWKAGEHVPQYESRARLEEMTLLADRLHQSFTDESDAAAWLRAPSDHLGGKAPLDDFLRGRFDVVESVLDARDGGHAR